MKSRRSARQDGEPPKQAAQRSKQDEERPIRTSRRRAAEAKTGHDRSKSENDQSKSGSGRGKAPAAAQLEHPHGLPEMLIRGSDRTCSKLASLRSRRASTPDPPDPQLPRTPSSPSSPSSPRSPGNPGSPELLPSQLLRSLSAPIPAATQLERSQLRSARPPCARPHPKTSTHNGRPSRRTHAYAHASPLTPARPDDPRSNEQS